MPQPPQFAALPPGVPVGTPPVSVQTVAPPPPVIAQTFGFDAGHVQVPVVQVPPAGQIAQLAPHAPSSVCGSVQKPHERLFGARHWLLHWPALQNWPVPHIMPVTPAQPPQCAVLVAGSMQVSVPPTVHAIWFWLQQSGAVGVPALYCVAGQQAPFEHD